MALVLVALALLGRALSDNGAVGATPLLVAACGLVLLPCLPRELSALSIRVALVPALGIASFSILLTTASLLGLRLGGVSIPLVATAFVVAAAAVYVVRSPAQEVDRAPPRRELLTLVVLAGIVAFALASSWDVAYPFEARGTDWGHYLLYADEVAVQGHLLIDDPFAGEPDRVFADPASAGALYGSLRLVDGLSSWSLIAGIVVVSALTVLSVFAAAAALWGPGPGLVAAAAYAVAPARLDLMSWYGLGTALALLFVPLVVLSLALLFRGARGRRQVVFLAVGLLGVTVSHTTSAIVVSATVVLAPLVDLAARLVGGGPGSSRAILREWWKRGIVRPLAAAVGIACVVGAGVIGHVFLQTRALGKPVSWRFLGPDWLSRASVEHYFGGPFLVVALVALVVVLGSRRLRSDRSLLAVVSLALACLLVGQAWRVHVSYDYQRVVYYFGIALVLLVGAAFAWRGQRGWWLAVVVLVLVALARSSVGLRLPERVLERAPHDPAVVGLEAFRERLDSGALPDTTAIVSDGCLHFAVPYLVRRPTLPAFSERQVGFEDRMRLARRAAAVLAGGSAGREAARRLGVGYVVTDPSCVPDPASRLGGITVLENGGVVVVRLPRLR